MKHINTLAIVDDDDIFVYLTKKAIEKTNFVDQVKIFRNGQEAITFLKENWENPSILPEIILLDLSMPVMDGWQFLDEYATIKPKIRKKIIIYIVTSSISPDDMKRAKNVDSVSDFIIKPITKEKLIEIIKNL